MKVARLGSGSRRSRSAAEGDSTSPSKQMLKRALQSSGRITQHPAGGDPRSLPHPDVERKGYVGEKKLLGHGCGSYGVH